MLHEFRNNTLRPGNPFSTISSQVKVGGTLSPTRGFRSDSLVAQPRSGQRLDHIDRSTAQSTTPPSQIDVLHLRLANDLVETFFLAITFCFHPPYGAPM